jgi:hypothetical protein
MELAIDENRSFVVPGSASVKFRIPIIVADETYYYDNLAELKKPIAAYVESFQQLHPVMIVTKITHLR